MADYELAPGAERDLEEIARYTLETWGDEHAERYGAALEEHFLEIASGGIRTRTIRKHRPELRVSRCGHHYVFHLERQGCSPLILAVLHENMDLITRIRNRLKDLT